MNNFEIDRIYEKYFSYLVKYATALTHNAEDAEDIVQNAFLKQIEYFKNKNDEICESTFLEYLKHAIRQLCIDLQQKMKF